VARSRELRVSITGDVRDFNRALGSMDSRLGTTEARITKFGHGVSGGMTTLAKSAGLAAAAIGGGLVFEGERAVKAFQETRKVAAQTNAVIKSTGGIAGVTASQVADLATAISKKTGVDDEAVQSASNLLLTFKNVHNEVGRGNDVFNRATQAAVDLSAAGFGSLDTTAKQLGKALNDPIKGITALNRAGVTFTQQQKDQIKWLVENNRQLDAQKIIMREVESQVSGSAAAQATNLDKLKVAFGNVQEAIGGGLDPAVQSVAGSLTKLAQHVEPVLNRTTKEMEKTFGRKDLDLGEKIQISASSVRRNFKPFTDEIGRQFKSAHLGDKLGAAVEAGMPKVFEAAGKGGTKAVTYFLKGWWNADGWGKLATAAFITAKLGGFSAAGSFAAGKLATRFKTALAGEAAIAAAGEAAGVTASAHMAAGMTGHLPKSLDARKGKLGASLGGAFKGLGAVTGIAIGMEIVGGIQQEIAKHKKDGGVLGTLATLGNLALEGAQPIKVGGHIINLDKKAIGALVNALSGDKPSSKQSQRTADSILSGLTGIDSGTQNALDQITSGSRGGKLSGTVHFAPGASSGVHSGVKSLASATAGLYGSPLTVGTGKQGHSLRTASGNISDHSTGDAVDIHAKGAELIRMGQDALIAAGADPDWARKQRGGLYNIKTPGGGRAQIIFNTNGPGIGDHTDHLHIGLKGNLGSLASSKGISRLTSQARLTPAQRTIKAAANKYGIDPAILYGIYGQESAFGKNAGTSPAGATGPFQLMPATARSLGVKNPNDLRQAAAGAAKYFAQLLKHFGGDTKLAIAAYNAGPGAVDKYGGIPPYGETQAYVPKVLANARKFPDLSSADAGIIGPDLKVDRGDPTEIARAMANRLLAPISRARARATRPYSTVGARYGGRIDTFDNMLSQAQQAAGLVDEDIATPGGRSARIAELAGIRDITLNKGFAQQQRIAAIRKEIAGWAKAVKQASALLKRTRNGTQRGVIKAKIAQYREHIRELQSEAKQLGADNAALGIDLTDTMNEIKTTDVEGRAQEEDRAQDMASAVAALTPGYADDVAAAQTRYNTALGRYNAAVGTGDAQKITEAAGKLKEAGDTLKEAGDALKDQAYQPFRDLLKGGDAALVMAQVNTPGDTSDDLVAYKGELKTATQAYNDAVARGDTDQIIEFGGVILSIRSSIDGLTGAINENTSQLADLRKQQNEDLQKNLNVSQAQYKAITVALANLIGGEIGGRVGLGAATVGAAGSVARY
jgi:hypothetical protein